MSNSAVVLTHYRSFTHAVQTVTDRAAIVEHLRDANQLLSKPKSLQAFIDRLTERYAGLIQEILSVTAINPSNQLMQIIAALEELPVATLTLAYEPNYRQIQSFSTIVRRTTQQPALLEIVFDPRIAAGCIVGFQGKRIDASAAALLKTVHK